MFLSILCNQCTVNVTLILVKEIVGLIYCLFNWAFFAVHPQPSQIVLSDLYSAVLKMHSSRCDLL